MHFHLVTAAGEIGVLLAVPCHLLIKEIILLLFDALREKLGAHDQWQTLRFFLGEGARHLINRQTSLPMVCLYTRSVTSYINLVRRGEALRPLVTKGIYFF